MRWLAFDIGGANLKIADGQGYAVSTAFPLWKEPGKLTEKLRREIEQAPPSDQLAVTMTGELADCFATKQDGVRCILEAVQAAADARGIQVYINTGVLARPELVHQNPLIGAATNWHALASYAGRYAHQETALLIDAGSTTCDIIPLECGRPVSDAVDDLQRLLSGQLLYTGVERSPLCAILQTVRYRNAECPIAQEWFATMQDVYLVLGDLPPDGENQNTADGKGATVDAARARLARHLSASVSQFSAVDARAMADQAAEQQQGMLARSIQSVVRQLREPPSAVILSGVGEFLVRRALERLDYTGDCISLGTQLGQQVSCVAPAHALAVLARESELLSAQ